MEDEKDESSDDSSSAPIVDNNAPAPQVPTDKRAIQDDKDEWLEDIASALIVDNNTLAPEIPTDKTAIQDDKDEWLEDSASALIIDNNAPAPEMPTDKTAMQDETDEWLEDDASAEAEKPERSVLVEKISLDTAMLCASKLKDRRNVLLEQITIETALKCTTKLRTMDYFLPERKDDFLTPPASSAKTAGSRNSTTHGNGVIKNNGKSKQTAVVSGMGGHKNEKKTKVKKEADDDYKSSTRNSRKRGRTKESGNKSDSSRSSSSSSSVRGGVKRREKTPLPKLKKSRATASESKKSKITTDEPNKSKKNHKALSSPSSNESIDELVQPAESDDSDMAASGAPVLVCANGLSDCKGIGISSFPCRRCHREFYCSKDHQIDPANVERHKSECKTPAMLEIIEDEEYSIWLKFSAPYLYDVCLNFVLVWPSLTVQWLPNQELLGGGIVRHKMLLGTQTTGEMNHLLVCGIDIPNKSKSIGDLHVLQRINHNAEVHRARYMPQDQNIIATKSPSKDVFVFKCSDFSEVPENDTFRPTLRLVGHTKDGFGLSWNPNKSGQLLSGSSDGFVCMWDINGTPGRNNNKESSIKSTMRFTKHSAPVEDVNWNPFIEHKFASVGGDKRLVLWDTRKTEAAHCIVNAHTDDINAVSFSPFSEYTLATGGSDKIVAVWDTRRFVRPLDTLVGHTNSVLQVQWSPYDSSVLASAGSDKKVYVWNMKKGGQRKPEAAANQNNEDDAPRAEFHHGGHVMSVNDISWSTSEKNIIASVSADNILQVWRMSKGFVQKDSDGDSDNESSMDK